jgi:hypothetical protein
MIRILHFKKGKSVSALSHLLKIKLNLLTAELLAVFGRLTIPGTTLVFFKAIFSSS